jgi:mono/diheme cytochrome c family protein
MSRVASAKARTVSFADTLAASRSRAGIALALLVLFAEFASFAADAEPQAGLVVTFVTREGNRSDRAIAPNVWLHVEAGKPPTPFMPGGQFTATWEGAVSAELRGNFSFQAELNGALKLEINGVAALETTQTGGASSLSKPIQLNKGPNTFKATFTSPEKGDAFVRLAWTEKPPFTDPIPLEAFTHTSTPELKTTAQLRLGRELFLEHRCFKCHTDPKLAGAGVPELKMDAPVLDGIGARRHYDWMARWILDPKSLRPTAQMPKLLTGPEAKADAESIAAYLASLKSGGEVTIPETVYRTRQNELAEGEGHAPNSEAKPVYERLHCIGCHNPPDAAEPDPLKLSQKRIAEKFPAGKLADFLRSPEAHYSWTRMPNFHLSASEATELEEWLFAAAPKAPLVTAPTDAALIERGRKLVQTTGCLNCHGLTLENQFKAPSLDALHGRHLKKRDKVPAGDCLGSTPLANYSFSAEERAALEQFTLAGFDSLARHVPAEFAVRQARSLNCVACHGQVELVPPFEPLGGRLKPEWAAKFIGGDIPHKIRYDAHPKGEPWVAARMPAFKSRAREMAVGMAQQHGYAPKTVAEPTPDAALAEIGRKLVGKDGGFSCVSCHGVGSLLAMEVFESEGVNLAYSAERLLPHYYRRWVRAPTSIDPQTKMPVYFDEGKSPLTELLGGDAEKQINAIWEYLRLGDKMPAPKTE